MRMESRRKLHKTVERLQDRVRELESALDDVPAYLEDRRRRAQARAVDRINKVKAIAYALPNKQLHMPRDLWFTGKDGCFEDTWQGEDAILEDYVGASIMRGYDGFWWIYSGLPVWNLVRGLLNPDV